MRLREVRSGKKKAKWSGEKEHSGMLNKHWEIQFSPFRGQHFHMLLNPRGSIQRNIRSHAKNFQAERPFLLHHPIEREKNGKSGKEEEGKTGING
ncbi:hypothetical protein POVCU2_0031240 [Plasmodium ovale curtisi]|uniref:Uncharacterized protein n=1 Tax=Plasmodium ovale curtisi TaxID=864141 RepID=A0A1A8W2M6_PLAOA|nr:hypothetical protein POVCU2_0031240 [Plasmodium ovale curtisi]SBS94558.1 hypothetical protein POVCU1_028570 [Plasmodium ovale curtisi]